MAGFSFASTPVLVNAKASSAELEAGPVLNNKYYKYKDSLIF